MTSKKGQKILKVSDFWSDNQITFQNWTVHEPGLFQSFEYRNFFYCTNVSSDLRSIQ